MANHKRRRPKHQRAGCLMCKPHKDERAPKSCRNARAAAILAEPIVEANADLFMLDIDWWEDDFCDCDECHGPEAAYDATPLRVTLAEVAA